MLLKVQFPSVPTQQLIIPSFESKLYTFSKEFASPRRTFLHEIKVKNLKIKNNIPFRVPEVGSDHKIPIFNVELRSFVPFAVKILRQLCFLPLVDSIFCKPFGGTFWQFQFSFNLAIDLFFLWRILWLVFIYFFCLKAYLVVICVFLGLCGHIVRDERDFLDEPIGVFVGRVLGREVFILFIVSGCLRVFFERVKAIPICLFRESNDERYIWVGHLSYVKMKERC